jgi:hypothetical protein
LIKYVEDKAGPTEPGGIYATYPWKPLFKAHDHTHGNCPSWPPGLKTAGMFSVVFSMKKFEFIPKCIVRDLK